MVIWQFVTNLSGFFRFITVWQCWLPFQNNIYLMNKDGNYTINNCSALKKKKKPLNSLKKFYWFFFYFGQHRSLVKVLLRWRITGWMEMGQLQVETVRWQNTDCSDVHRLWNQFKNEESVAKGPIQGCPCVTTSSEDCFLALSAWKIAAAHSQSFCSHWKKYICCHCEKASRSRALHKKICCVCISVPLIPWHRAAQLCWAPDLVTWTREQWNSVHFTDKSRVSLYFDSCHILIWGRWSDQSNILDRNS